MNPMIEAFDPNWISSPGDTISDILTERGWAIAEFAAATHRTSYDVAQLLMGVATLTPVWADQLANTIGASRDFWLRREAQYRRDIVRLSATDRGSAKSWLEGLPIKDMIGNHWIEKADTTEELTHNALAFFGVASIAEWRRTYDSTLRAAAYRASLAYAAHPASDVAWLRQGEVQARAIDCLQWNRDLFLSRLPRLRRLTREPNPSSFLPELQRVCAEAGVAAVVARAPEGCRASGATKFTLDGKALMLLSFRYLNDDQFWFTVFHEAAHLILHSADSLFLEGSDFELKEAEREADSFARAQLFPDGEYDALHTLALNRFAIGRLARRLGISPGIVVGQLQQIGRVPYKHFNYMKVRYAWED
jgi:HTH-type transcriptional regulator/antitoxin HigA